jgi:branched-chain amino acid aminotransferase
VDVPSNEHILVNINGVLHPRQEAKIAVFDSGYLVGDGVWEAFREHGVKMLFVHHHLDRLWQAAKVVEIAPPFE